MRDGNFIPLLAIIYAAISSINSVGVSIYQEYLYKVNNPLQSMALTPLPPKECFQSPSVFSFALL